MSRYVDGFVVPVPKRKVAAYARMSKKAGEVWREHGAVEYRECVGEDLKVPMGLPFPRALKVKPAETVFFSWIAYKSRAHRDRVNAKVMKDKRILAMMKQGKKAMPFDVKRMLYGGFEVLVDV